MKSFISFLLFSSLVLHLQNGSDAQAEEPMQIHQPPPRMHFECAPEDFDDSYYTVGDVPPTLPVLPRVNTTVLHSDPRHVLYERAKYAMIPKNGSLPPPATVEAKQYPVYRFVASRHDASPNRAVRQKLLRFIRLPYQFENGHLLECIVFNINGSEFFILERFREPLGTAGKVRIPIHNTVVENVERQYVELPYMNYRDQFFVIQTWVILTHLEHDTEAPRAYGFFESMNNIRSNTPINAYMYHLYVPPQYVTQPPAGITGPVLTRLFITWLPGLCYEMAVNGKWFARDECDKQEWIIHTLIAERLYKLNVSSSDVEELADEEFDVPGLHERWRTVHTFYTTRMWLTRSWRLHGRHIFVRPRDYFSAALKLYDVSGAANLHQRLQHLGIQATHMDVYSYDHITQRLQNIFGANRVIYLSCKDVSTDVSVVVELHLCYERNQTGEWRIHSCDQKGERSCKDNVIFPPNYDTHPYLVLNVYKLPVPYYLARSKNEELIVVRKTDRDWVPLHQRAKLTPQQQKLWFVNEDDFGRWYLYGLCPSYQYNFIGFTYAKLANNLEELDYEGAWRPFRDIWPSITERFVTNIYVTCTLHLRLLNDPQLTGMNKYFGHTSRMFIALNTGNWQQNPILNQTDVALNTAVVQNAFRTHTGTSVLLQCLKFHGRNYLARVRVCYNRQLHRIDCPESLHIFRVSRQELQFQNCGQQLIIPSLPETI